MIYRVCLKILLITGCINFAAGNSVQAQNARIKIDLNRTIGEVNKYTYENFVEHPGRSIYEGIYDTASSKGKLQN